MARPGKFRVPGRRSFSQRLQSFGVSEPMAGHGRRVVVEAGQARFVVNEPNGIHLRAALRVERHLRFGDDSGVAGPVGEEVGERVQMMMRRRGRTEQKPDEIEGRQPARSAPAVPEERRTEVATQPQNSESFPEAIEFLSSLSRRGEEGRRSVSIAFSLAGTSPGSPDPPRRSLPPSGSSRGRRSTRAFRRSSGRGSRRRCCGRQRPDAR